MLKPLWIILLITSLTVCLTFLVLAGLVLRGIAIDNREDAKAFHPHYVQSVQAVKEQPQSPYAHMGLGLSLYDKHEYKTAIVEFNKSIRLGAPRGGWLEHCHLYIARCCLALGNKDAAHTELKEVLKLSPPTEEGTMSIGNEAVELLADCQ